MWQNWQMKEHMATLDQMGRIVVPASFRRALGIEPGARLVLRLDDQGLHVQSASQALAKAQELVRRYVPAGHSLADELISDRQRESSGD